MIAIQEKVIKYKTIKEKKPNVNECGNWRCFQLFFAKIKWYTSNPTKEAIITIEEKLKVISSVKNANIANNEKKCKKPLILEDLWSMSGNRLNIKVTITKVVNILALIKFKWKIKWNIEMKIADIKNPTNKCWW